MSIKEKKSFFNYIQWKYCNHVLLNTITFIWQRKYVKFVKKTEIDGVKYLMQIKAMKQ